MTLELPREESSPSDLDEMVSQLDGALDAIFLGDLADAMARAAAARPPEPMQA